MDTLAPCPFCGSDDIGVSLFNDGVHVRNNRNPELAFQAMCNGCHAKGPAQPVDPSSPRDGLAESYMRRYAVELAAVRWNHRGSPADLAAALEAIRKREDLAGMAFDSEGFLVLAAPSETQ